jgi:hypothetical protein
MRTPVLLALGSLLVTAGCERRTAAPNSAADSTAVTDSTGTDSTTRDSTARDSAGVSVKIQTKSVRDSIIGHDSAFGPIGVIDSTGKVVPIRTKRP